MPLLQDCGTNKLKENKNEEAHNVTLARTRRRRNFRDSGSAVFP
jgi:hypothetical protein